MPTISDMKDQMDAAIDAMRREFSGVRTGKATPTLLDTVRVEAYGSKMPLNQVANVSSPEARMLVVQPYDKNVLSGGIRVPIPPLSEERRQDMVKLLHKMAEEGRISVRHARQEGNKTVKELEHDHEISEDESRRRLDKIQEITDEYIAKIDEMMKKKEAEVLEV